MSSNKRDVLINLVKFYLIGTGLWPKPLSKNRLLNKIFSLYSLFERFFYFTFYVSISVELLRLIAYGYSTQIILASFSVVVNATKVSVKAIIYIKNNVFELYDEVIDAEKEVWSTNNPDIINLYLRKSKTGKLFRILLTYSTLVAIIGLNATGEYGTTQLIKYNLANNASLETHYFYQFWFPGNKLQHLNCVRVIQYFCSYTGLMYNVATHMALITLLVYLATHLSILQYRLRHYISHDLTEDQMNETILVLKGFILEHQYLIGYVFSVLTYLALSGIIIERFMKKVNDRCTNIVMMEFVLSSFDAASVTITIIKLEVSEMVWLMAFLVLLVIQIFCLAWSCNEVNIESQAVADAAFESRWWLLNKDGKQLTQLMIQQAQQRPLMMTIGPFGPMTMQSFLAIWKMAYSYLSIMR